MKTFILTIISLISVNWLFATLKVACRVKANTTWTRKKINFSHYFSKTFKTSIFQGYKRYMKYLGLEIFNLRTQFLLQILTQWRNFYYKFCLLRAPSPYKINFLVYISIQYIQIKRIFKTVPLFFLRLCGFWETQISRSKSYRSITFSKSAWFLKIYR